MREGATPGHGPVLDLRPDPRRTPGALAAALSALVEAQPVPAHEVPPVSGALAAATQAGATAPGGLGAAGTGAAAPGAPGAGTSAPRASTSAARSAGSRTTGAAAPGTSPGGVSRVVPERPPRPGDELIAHLGSHLAGLDDLPRPSVSPLDEDDAGALLEMLRAQFASRWTDVAARRARAKGSLVATLASAGHEMNAAVAWAVRPGDPAVLHHRSSAFLLARARQAGYETALDDLALALAGRADDPASGGRHRGPAHPDLAIVPAVSGGPHHLPRALGMAWALGRQQGLPVRWHRSLRWRDDAIVIASIGDAAAAHSTAAGVMQAACWSARRGMPLPLLVVCEDNGLGLSMRTPDGWIEDLYSGRRDLLYLRDEGRDPMECLAVARQAAEVVREERRPVFLHLPTVRLGGHAGSDVETAYRSAAEIGADQERDPLIATMRCAVLAGVLSPGEVRALWDQVGSQAAAAMDRALLRPVLDDPAIVAVGALPGRADVVADRAVWAGPEHERSRVFGDKLPETEGPLTLAQSLNRTLADAAVAAGHLVVLGQDVGRKGGVHGVTRGLLRRLGQHRVIDLPPDEAVAVGLGLGGGLAGLLPVVELPGLGAWHQVQGLVRGEGAGLAFSGRGAWRNPLVLRVPGGGPVPGATWAGLVDQGLATLRDVPGLLAVCPAHPSEAPHLLRTALAAAEVEGSVVVVLEPQSLYHERDLYVPGDGGWQAVYPDPSQWAACHMPIGTAGTWGSGTDVTFAAFGHGVRMSLRVAARLAAEGVTARVVDLRWLHPLPIADVVREATATGRLVVVDQGRHGAGVSEGLVTGLLEAGYAGRMVRVTAEDSFVPAGEAAHAVLVGEQVIEDAARALLA